MTLRTGPRPDVGYLRRRPKLGEQTKPAGVAASTASSGGGLSLTRPASQATPTPSGGINMTRPTSAQSAPAPSSGGGLSLTRPASAQSAPAPSSGGGLSLTRPGPAQAAPAPSTGALTPPGGSSVASRLPEPPRIEDTAALTVESPVVRLNARQSAIGSLSIAGVNQFGWEAQNGNGGLQRSVDTVSPNPHPTNIMPTFANRPLVQFYKGDVILGLRHVNELRRLVLHASSGSIEATLYDGTRIVADTGDGNNAVLVSVIGNEVEFRLEVINQANITDAFSLPIQR